MELFKFIEEPLDKITFPAKGEVGFLLHCSIAFWRYDRRNPAVCQSVDQPVCVICPVSKDGIRINILQHRVRPVDIRMLSRCDVDLHRIAQGIADGMDLCAQFLPGSSYGLIRSPFLRGLRRWAGAPGQWWCRSSCIYGWDMPDPVGFPIGHAFIAIPFNKCANRDLVERARICELAKLCVGGRFIQLASGLCRGGESLLHPAIVDHF